MSLGVPKADRRNLSTSSTTRAFPTSMFQLTRINLREGADGRAFAMTTGGPTAAHQPSRMSRPLIARTHVTAADPKQDG